MYSEIHSSAILRKGKKTDSWFLSRYGMNLYRGCTHNCLYCDGRAERYYVNGEFGRDVEVKINAVDLLRRELSPIRKRVPLKKGFVMAGGGVGDSYQPAEEQYRLTRQALEFLLEKNYPVHILTKSSLVERDMDVLEEINRKSKAIVSMSFSSVDDAVSRIFEPGASPPKERLDTLKKFKDRGILCGLFLMPVIPYITDTTEKMDEVFRSAKSSGVDFIIFSGMTLKEGRQKGYFMNALRDYDASLIPRYLSLYKGDHWGGADWSYYESIHHTFYQLAKKYRISLRIPVTAVRDFLEEKDRVIVILEQMDYLLKFRNVRSSYGKAAKILSQMNDFYADDPDSVDLMPGIDRQSADVIREIITTGNCKEYDKHIRFE